MKNILSNTRQAKRTRRIRARLLDRSDLPRLIVKRSNQHLHTQIIGARGKVLAAASSAVGAIHESPTGKLTKTEQAREVGVKLAQLAKKADLSAAVLDRRHYRFHGRIKALVESLNKSGIKV
jgi:large subunit ribosomal protein L18